jgi:hypothetical protein
MLLGKKLRKRPLGSQRSRREDNIKIYIGEIYFEDERWVDLAQYYIQ